MDWEPWANFDLAFERTDYQLLAIVRDSPIGIATAPINIPIHDREIRFFWQQMIQEYGNPDADLGMQYQRAVDLGERLYRFVFAQPIQSALAQSSDLAYQQRLRLRIRLLFSDVPELMNLPWEYLYDPAAGNFLSLSVQVPLMRHLNLLHQIRPVAATLPLRILVVIASPINMPPIDMDSEWLALIDTLDHLALDRKLVLERLREPTTFGLQRQLRQNRYHALHFIGFGDYDQISQDGMLIFEDQTRRSRTVSGHHIGSILRDHDSMRLVCLNLRFPSMAGSMELTQRMSPFDLAANSIAMRGIPAVVAISQELPPFAYLTFYDEVYGSLTDLRPIDVAVAKARQTVAGEQRSAAWGVPVLLTRTADGTLFYDSETGPPPSVSPHLPQEDRSLYLRYWQ